MGQNQGMALIECYECEKEISDKAPACPHCGAPKCTPKPTKTKTGRGDKKNPDRFNDWSDETVTVVRPKKISE